MHHGPAVAEAPRFVNADSVPELAARRQDAARKAAETLANNRDLVYEGHAEQVPKAVDILGTARKLRSIEEEHGKDSPEYEEAYEGFMLDCERLAGEAASTNGSEYFGLTGQVFRSEEEGYYSFGLSISEMGQNGLSPFAHPEEQERRIHDVVAEDGTAVPVGSMIKADGLYEAAHQLRLSPERQTSGLSIEITTITPCADYAEERYRQDQEQGRNGTYGGYRPALKALAIRRSHYAAGSPDRQDEQVIIPGIYITPDVVHAVLAEEGGIRPGQELGKTELYGTQLLSMNDGSVMNQVERLDRKASQVHGKNVFMGEEVPEDHPKNYEAFKQEAQERRDRLVPLPKKLANLTIDLERRGVDSGLADLVIRDMLKSDLLGIAEQHPDLAEAIFGTATAEGFKEVARLEAAGREDEARYLRAQIEAAAPDPDFCSGGGVPTARGGEQMRAGGSNIMHLIAGSDEDGPLAFVCPNGHLCIRKPGTRLSACQNGDCDARVAC